MRTTTWRSSTKAGATPPRRCGTCARIASWCRRDRPRRHQRLQLRRLAGELLSGGPLREEDARLVRRALRHGGDQLLVLSEAHREDPRGLGGASARALPLRAQGLATDHAPEAPARLRGVGGVVRRRGAHARAAARGGPLPAASEPESRPAAPARLPPPAPAGPARGVRVPARELVCRGDVRGPARRWRGALYRRERRAGDPPGSHRGLRIPAPAPPRLRRRGAVEMGRPRADVRGRGVRVLQARGRGARPGVREGVPAHAELVARTAPCLGISLLRGSRYPFASWRRTTPGPGV